MGIIIVLAVAAGLVGLFKIWNVYSRKFNKKILLQSTCEQCHQQMGEAPIKLALPAWLEEVEEMKKSGPIVKVRNLKLVCQTCGHANMEQNFYKRWRSKK